MGRKLLKPWFLCVLYLLFLASCQEPAQSAGCAALDALRKVQAATQAGPNFDLYSSLVVEAKAETNKAARVLDDGPLESALNSAIDNYVDGITIWRMKIQGEPLDVYRGEGYTLLPKYSIQVDPTGKTVEYDKALAIVWSRADKRLDEIATECK
jgi:hypothetical protein